MYELLQYKKLSYSLDYNIQVKKLCYSYQKNKNKKLMHFHHSLYITPPQFLNPFASDTRVSKTTTPKMKKLSVLNSSHQCFHRKECIHDLCCWNTPGLTQRKFGQLTHQSSRHSHRQKRASGYDS